MPISPALLSDALHQLPATGPLGQLRAVLGEILAGADPRAAFGFELPEPSDIPPEVAKLSALRVACDRMGFEITFDEYVTEAAAARLLNRKIKTLRNRRHLDQPIETRKVGGRVEYALADIARYLVANTENSF